MTPGAPVPLGGADGGPAGATTNSTADPGAAGTPAPAPASGPDVSGTETDRGVTTRRARATRLGDTGDGTRRLIILGGIAMLLGAVIIGFSSRDEGLATAPVPAPAGALAAAAARRRRNRPRRGELFGWEDGVPLNPGARELARRRAGFGSDYEVLTAVPYSDDEPGA